MFKAEWNNLKNEQNNKIENIKLKEECNNIKYDEKNDEYYKI